MSTATHSTLSDNVLLFFIKMAAAIQSGSLSVISSLVDSTLDLFSGVVIAVTSYLMRHYNPFNYLIGQTMHPLLVLTESPCAERQTERKKERRKEFNW